VKYILSTKKFLKIKIKIQHMGVFFFKKKKSLGKKKS